MNLGRLSKPDLVKTLDLIDYCVNARGDQDGFQHTVDALHELIPFDAAMFGILNIENNQLRSTPKTFNYHFNTEFLDIYAQQGMAKIDPIVLRALDDHAPSRWQDAFATHTLKHRETEVKALRGLASDFGLNKGIACATKNPRAIAGSEISFLCLSMEHEKAAACHFEILKVLMPHLHHLAVDIHSAQEAPLLTARERETLIWATEGKSTWETGRILSISERTVKFHLSNCYSKLQVMNRAQAIAKAMRMKVI